MEAWGSWEGGWRALLLKGTRCLPGRPMLGQQLLEGPQLWGPTGLNSIAQTPVGGKLRHSQVLFFFFFRKRDMNWLPCACSRVGPWPQTQACTLMGN